MLLKNRSIYSDQKYIKRKILNISKAIRSSTLVTPHDTKTHDSNLLKLKLDHRKVKSVAKKAMIRTSLAVSMVQDHSMGFVVICNNRFHRNR